MTERIRVNAERPYDVVSADLRESGYHPDALSELVTTCRETP